jgi:N-acyl-D-amino-acid deacylase
MIIGRFNAMPSYEGLTLAEIAKIRNEDPVSTYLTLIQMSQKVPGESIIAKAMDLEDIKVLIEWPFTNLCSDGGPNGHPRGWGAFPRYLNMDSDESLPQKIHKMTGQSAENLALDSIGYIREGYYADIVLFDPKSVKDNATYSNSNLKASGIKFVMVSGQVVFKDDSPTMAFPGRVIIKKRN